MHTYGRALESQEIGTKIDFDSSYETDGLMECWENIPIALYFIMEDCMRNLPLA